MGGSYFSLAGSIGFLSCILFIQKIYSTKMVKVDQEQIKQVELEQIKQVELEQVNPVKIIKLKTSF